MRRTLISLAILVLLGACGAQIPGTPTAGDHPTGSATSVSPTTSPASPPATNTATAPPTRPPPAAPAVCTVRDLTASLGASDGTAGTMYRALVFTNTGGRTCTIQGFPGVSFVAGDDGHQVGEAAVRVDPKGPVVTLRPGGTANSAVGFVNIGAFDPAQCQPTAVRGLRVYPPQERRAEFVPFETTACAGELLGNHQLTVRTVRAGSVPS